MQVNEALLYRIDDHRFLDSTKLNEPVIINVSGIYNNGNLCFRVATEAQKHLTKEDEKTFEPFTVGGRTWKIMPRSGSGGKLMVLINHVHKVFFDNHANEFEVKEWAYFGSWFAHIQEPIENVSLSLSDHFYIYGCGQEQILLIDRPLQHLPFTDPFTTLAAIAYQQFESHYRNKDSFSLQDCDTRIIYDKGFFRLVHKDNPLALDKRIIKQTTVMYANFIRKEYGHEKIEEVEFRYGLNFDELSTGDIGLTPEHVYRVNIGVNYVETKNLRDTWQVLYDLYHQPNHVKDRTPLDSYLETDKLPGRVKRAIYHCLRGKGDREPNKGNLIEWLSQFATKDGFDGLSLKSLNTLIYLLLPDKESCERSLTGRKIYGFIRSYYTNADYGEYKPWVDQQELLQTIYALSDNSSRDYSLEKLAHVVVKKHLIRSLPKGRFRVGAIIPAPYKLNWYKVSMGVDTTWGINSYILENILPRFSREKTVLYRSTDSRYINSSLNDLSPLGPPGQQGMKQMALSAFQENSIPIWVAYTRLALKEKNPKIKYDYLCKANHSLVQLSTKEHQRRNLRQIIQKYDAILNELYRLYWSSWSKFSAYASLCDYLSGSCDNDEKKEEQLANALYQQLAQISPDEEDRRRKRAIVELKDELLWHILFYCKGARCKRQEKYQDILHYEKKYAEITDLDCQLVYLSHWTQKLEAIAKEQKEDIESKKPLNMVLAGHSLGGACAQLHLIYFFVDRDRIPLPDHECLGYFLDEPAINDEDNERFKKWGWNHRDLFKKLNVRFVLERRQEAGDSVPLVGEVHLGATFSEKEDRRLKEWLSYKFCVRERMDKPKNLAIALSSCAHETQFEEGVVDVDYKETRYSSVVQGQFDTRARFFTVYDDEKGCFIRQDLASEVKREKWESIRKQWGLSTFHSAIDLESFRTHRYCSLFYYLFMGGSVDSLEGKPLDDKGIFAVDENGTIPKKFACVCKEPDKKS